MTTQEKSLAYQAVGIVVGLAMLYVAFRVAGAGWNASAKK